MEHVTEGLYMAAAAGVFVLAVSLMLLTGRAVDQMFLQEQAIRLSGELLWEEQQQKSEEQEHTHFPEHTEGETGHE